MSLLTVSGITKSYGLQQVLESVSFIIGPGEKVALVGRNGSGKTTLLRLIAGVETPDAGGVSLLPGTHVGHLAQDPDLSGGDALLAAVAHAVPRLVEMERRLRELESHLEGESGHSEERYAAYVELQQEYAQAGGPAYAGRVKATLAGLGFRESDFDLPVPALSGGQRTRAGLCMLLLQEPDVLLLDEPTNHLDLPAIEWLEDYLGRTRSALLIVSHDRYFLDRVVSRVVELDGAKLYSTPGNYTAYARLREERLAQQQVQWERNQEQVAKLEDYIRRYRVSRATQAKSREKALARIQMDPPPRTRDAELRLNLTAGLRSGNEVLRIERLSKAYGDKPLFSGLEMVVQRGERVGIIGPNGSGKTTLLRIVMGQVQPEAGHFAFGHNVEPGYFAQDLSGAQPENTLMDEILDAGASTYEEARGLLARFLFYGDDVFKRVADLSGGETNRLALARLLLSRANLLLLDEPTNHLDIAARDRLEQALLAFPGTILFASHDRYLLDRVATRMLEVAGGEAKVYNDTYAEYRRRKAREKLLAEQAAARAARSAPVAARPVERPARGSRPQDLRRAVKAVEERITAAEARVREIEALLADAATYADLDRTRAATAEYEALNASLPEFYSEWERLAEQVEAIAAR